MAGRERFTLADDPEMGRRKTRAERFYRRILVDEDAPWVVSDVATVLDLTTLAPAQIRERTLREYRVAVSEADLLLPFWQLLDLVEAGGRC